MAKRAIQMTWVNPEEESPRRPTYDAPRYPRGEASSSVDIPEIIKTTATGVGTVIFGYVILDTARNIIVSRFGGK